MILGLADHESRVRSNFALAVHAHREEGSALGLQQDPVPDVQAGWLGDARELALTRGVDPSLYVADKGVVHRVGLLRPDANAAEFALLFVGDPAGLVLVILLGGEDVAPTAGRQNGGKHPPTVTHRLTPNATKHIHSRNSAECH